VMAGIELQQVTKRYPDGTEGVKTLDLGVGDGEFMILVGPSGRRAAGSPRRYGWSPAWRRSPRVTC
jgi:energy-coupling factor transporter ATP-binding protein EcfA2